MKIAILSWESLHSIAVGGVAQHVTELAAALERRGHEVHVFVRTGQGQNRYDLIHGVHYHRCPIDLNPDFVTEMNNMCNSLIWHLGEIEALQGPFDIVHAHDWMCAKALVQAKNDRHSNTVITIHSTEFGRCGNRHVGGYSDRISAIEAEGIYCADRVIIVSGVLAEEVKRIYKVPNSKLKTIYNGIHCRRFDTPTDPGHVRRQIGVGPMDPTILFVGRLEYQKGPDLLLEAVPELLQRRADAKFVFAGDGTMRWDLERRTNQLGVKHAVRFLGAFNSNRAGQLVRLFKSTDAVCVPSRNEPFGIVILEAWAAQKPVVATENGGPREIITPGQNGYLVYDNPGSIAWGIHRIFDDFSNAQSMGKQGRVTASKSYNWDNIAEQTESLYSEILGSKTEHEAVGALRNIEMEVEKTTSIIEEVEHATVSQEQKVDGIETTSTLQALN
ncbi:MAG: glycosyltransferase family 4 protein [SAR324 cluster bacterium]|uniref:Glycosyltransferase family 4 protein n=1 Tax=SAR324 cluster bacterium TaxID=2024889 RepID=A0A7X9II25_9DELT|nr:glycosyltransferase family 4 protein [SAR324 cluster bacterium]